MSYFLNQLFTSYKNAVELNSNDIFSLDKIEELNILLNEPDNLKVI